MNKLYTLLLSAAAILLFNIAAVALENEQGELNVITSVPRDMTYQGILKDNAGNPLPDSMVTLVLRIYDDYVAGDLEWSDAIVVVTDDGGYFVATLAMVNLPFDEDYWLEVEVEGEILTPRQKINMVGYSARSDTSDYAASGGGWVDDGLNVRLESSYDKVGIGISSPSNKLHVVGSESVPILNVEQNGSFRATRFYSQNACALWVEHAGNHGLRITNANGRGIYIQNAGSDGIRIDNASGWAGYFGGKGYFEDSVGIGTSTPTEKLDIAGSAKMTGFKLPTSASDGYVLTSDGSGTGTWQAPSGGADSDWVISDTNMYSGVSGNVGIGTSTPLEKLHIDGNIYVGGKATIGPGHTNTGIDAFVAGANNTASGNYATVGGGGNNTSVQNYTTVGGGRFNVADGVNSTISGGYYNTAGGSASVGGGYLNTASGIAATISGGSDNVAGGNFSIIPGGTYNNADAQYTFAAGHRAKAIHSGAFVWADHTDADFSSTADDQFLVRAGGGVGINNDSPGAALHIGGTPGVDGLMFPDGTLQTTAGGQSVWEVTDSVIYTSEKWGIARGEANNKLWGDSSYTHINLGVACTTGTSGQNSYYLTIGGGINNTASDNHATVSGGGFNVAGGSFSAIGGGNGNTASGGHTTVAGGESNRASGGHSAVGGGSNNMAYGAYSTISGGYYNTTNDYYSVVAGGRDNDATASSSAISGGSYNDVSGGNSTIVGGSFNTASGSNATVAGGSYCAAAGWHSFAAGRRAQANNDGSFVWADNHDVNFSSTADDQFNVRASGGTRIFSEYSLNAGVTLAAGASAWASVSDSTLKRNIRPVDGEVILEKLSELPVSRWSYKTQDESIEHIGPMAQDFYAAFGLGEDERHISTIDPAGVALAGVKELIEIVNELREENKELKSRIEDLESKTK
ncbi:MAG: tail fiber domain-containing protein [Candidatus Zixiibacteriota bacterium]|nr:MAG: tail fiber domain-containing protein [candidate division Zixibacteria bacterium]